MSNSETYKGNYYNDKKCGYGIFIWPNGDSFKGNYFNDYRDGYGEMHYASGKIIKGIWEQGVKASD